MKTSPKFCAEIDPVRIGITVEDIIRGFLDAQKQLVPELPELDVFTDLLQDIFSSGGKRVRPALCIMGWYAVTDVEPPPAVWKVAASLELFHTFGLVHDDVMDRSETRRGQPSAHRFLSSLHRGHPNQEELGKSVAILLGDIALGWSFELLHDPVITQEQRRIVEGVMNKVRTETLIGQYLDLVSTGILTEDVEKARRIIRYKTTKYTVECPLHLGARLAKATEGQLAALSTYALPLGEAFQLRDDILGVYGDPRSTGKSRLDDLIGPKCTVLLATALREATVDEKRLMKNRFDGNVITEEDAAEIREILISSGAKAYVERRIELLREQALSAIEASSLNPTGTHALEKLARLSTDRSY